MFPYPVSAPLPIRVERARRHALRSLELNIYSADLYGMNSLDGVCAKFKIQGEVVYETDRQPIQDETGVRWSGETNIIPFAEWALSEFVLCQGDQILGTIRCTVSRFLGTYLYQPPGEVGAFRIAIPPTDGYPANDRYATLHIHIMEIPFSSPNITHQNWKPIPQPRDLLTARRRVTSFPSIPIRHSMKLLSHNSPSCPVEARSIPLPSDAEKERILQRFYQPNLFYNFLSQGKVDFGDGRILKYGSKIDLAEAARQHYIQQATSIPVPRVHYAFEHDGFSYIVMDVTPGNTLRNQVSDLNDSELDGIAQKLVEYVHELRALEPGLRKTMGSWPSGPFNNRYFDPPPLRPFKWVEELNEYLLQISDQYYGPSLLEMGRPTSFVLSHGDLNPSNIMAKDGQISGIIDWSTLGYYPNWWESMAAGMPAKPQWRAALRRTWDGMEEADAVSAEYYATFVDARCWREPH